MIKKRKVVDISHFSLFLYAETTHTFLLIHAHILKNIQLFTTRALYNISVNNLLFMFFNFNQQNLTTLIYFKPIRPMKTFIFVLLASFILSACGSRYHVQKNRLDYEWKLQKIRQDNYNRR